MQILRRRGWEIPERLVTPEAAVLGRRAVLAGAAALTAGPAAAAVSPAAVPLASISMDPPRDMAFRAGRALTPYKVATTYNT